MSSSSSSNGWILAYQPPAERLLLAGPARLTAYPTAGVLDRFMRSGMTLNSVAGLVVRVPDFGTRLFDACTRYFLITPMPQRVVRTGTTDDEDVLVRDPYYALRCAINQWQRFAHLCTVAQETLSRQGPCKTLCDDLASSTSAACCAATIDEYIAWLCQVERAVAAEYARCIVKRPAPPPPDTNDEETDSDEDAHIRCDAKRQKTVNGDDVCDIVHDSSKHNVKSINGL